MAQGPIISCTTTLTKVAPFNLDPTTTVYLSTETETSSVDCGGCVLAITTRDFGHGPVCLAFPILNLSDPIPPRTCVLEASGYDYMLPSAMEIPMPTY